MLVRDRFLERRIRQGEQWGGKIKEKKLGPNKNKVPENFDGFDVEFRRVGETISIYFVCLCIAVSR